MIDYNTIKPSDKVKVIGMGAPGFAKLGDTLEVMRVERQKVYVSRDDGQQAFFALTCGASRLELVPNNSLTVGGTPYRAGTGSAGC